MKKISRREAIKAGGLLASSLVVGSLSYASSTDTEPTEENSGETVFITGAARGIGLATAEVFAKSGVNVVIYDIASQIDGIEYPLASQQDLEKAKTQVESHGVKCLAIQGDVRSSEQLDKAVSKCISTFGRIDYLVANAGVVHMGAHEEIADNILELMLAVNVGGVAKTIRAVIPVMKKQESGRIVTLASTAGRGGSPYFSVYSATKFGVIGLTKSIAMELGQYNITCNAICPTGTRTDMLLNDHILQTWVPDNPTEEGISEAFRGGHPLPVGLLEPADIASMAKFLCSKEGAYLSGAILDTNAGWTAKNMA